MRSRVQHQFVVGVEELPALRNTAHIRLSVRQVVHRNHWNLPFLITAVLFPLPNFLLQLGEMYLKLL